MNHIGKAFLLIILLAGAAAAALTGKYPAAFVRAPAELGGKSHVIWKNDVERMASAAIAYYGNMAQATAPSSTLAANDPAISREARGKSLETLIRNKIVSDAVEAQDATDDVDALIAKTAESYAANPDFGTAVGMVYGLDGSGFMTFVLRPEAEKEALKAKNKWDDAAFAAWLEKEIAASTIARFMK